MNVTSYTNGTTHSLLKIIKSALQVPGRTAVSNSAHSDRITRRVAHALALRPRGGVRNDVLAIDRLAVTLHVQWLARDVHPWDHDLPERRRAELFAQQCLEDVDAAIPPLFEQLPEIDILEIGVLERDSKTRIIELGWPSFDSHLSSFSWTEFRMSRSAPPEPVSSVSNRKEIVDLGIVFVTLSALIDYGRSLPEPFRPENA